jgi:hypothetical protein
LRIYHHVREPRGPHAFDLFDGSQRVATSYVRLCNSCDST